MIDYLGSLSIGACVPVALTATAQLNVAIGAAIPELTAKLLAYGKLILQVSVTPPAVAVAAKIKAAVTVATGLAAAAAVDAPGVSLQVAALLAVVAEIELQLAALNLGLSFVGELTGILATAGVNAYAYAGRADALGPEFTQELTGGFPSGGGAAAHTNAIILATTSAATWAAMQGVFHTS